MEITTEFATEEQCLAYLERVRWPKGILCLRCGFSRVYRVTTKAGVRTKRYSAAITGKAIEWRIPIRHLYECLDPACRYQFTARTGTLFGDSHLSLQKWFLALALICNAKKGISALQMKRDLNVGYQTAWYLCHRIREAMESQEGMFGGTVEMDETYL